MLVSTRLAGSGKLFRMRMTFSLLPSLSFFLDGKYFTNLEAQEDFSNVEAQTFFFLHNPEGEVAERCTCMMTTRLPSKSCLDRLRQDVSKFAHKSGAHEGSFCSFSNRRSLLFETEKFPTFRVGLTVD